MKHSNLFITVFDALPSQYQNCPIIYAEGSYFNQSLPKEIDFVYIVIENKAELKRTLTGIYFEICEIFETPKGADIISTQSLPIIFNHESFYGKKIDTKTPMIFACLKEHLSSAIRYCYPKYKPFLRASCEIIDGRKTHSIPQEFDYNYPNSPLQDIELINYYTILKDEQFAYIKELDRIRFLHKSLQNYANLHTELGIQYRYENKIEYWHCREYAPDATELYIVYDADNQGNWKSFKYEPEENGFWSVKVPYDCFFHGMFHEIHLYGKYLEGKQIRVPAFANWVEQNKDNENQWCARFWHVENVYRFKHPHQSHENPIIYEAHVGIAKHNLDEDSQTERGFGSYKYFTNTLLPKIKEAGFNTIQLMGIPEHPLYKSFGYQVSSYFAPSHRFGTLNEFKELVDTAHGMGISILLDIVHSHSTPNTEQGLVQYDTGDYLFCSDRKTQWGTTFFDYSKEITRKFLLSNCRYWMEEFNIDGFRFDAVGSMIFNDEGFSDDFSHVNACFYTNDSQPRRNKNGILYLQLANTLIHEIYEQSITIAEEFSGTPGITSPCDMAGLGFDYRFAMGIPDLWAKYIEDPLPMGKIWHECTNHRSYDKTISYVECHDQCINGEDAMIWRIIGDDMYFHMSPFNESWNVSRGVALTKLMKLVVFMSADKGYMSFMGNEFGHPEWIDADVNPYRQWHLVEDSLLHYAGIALFNKDMFALEDKKLFTQIPRLLYIHEESRIICFERNNLLCALSFHETEAARVKFSLPAGKYREIFSSDEIKYSGHANLTTADSLEHFTSASSGTYEQEIEIYLPPLTALILRKE